MNTKAGSPLPSSTYASLTPSRCRTVMSPPPRASLEQVADAITATHLGNTKRPPPAPQGRPTTPPRGSPPSCASGQVFMSLTGKLKERTRGGARTLFGAGVVDQRLARALLSGRPAVARHGAVLTSGKSSKRETGFEPVASSIKIARSYSGG